MKARRRPSRALPVRLGVAALAAALGLAVVAVPAPTAAQARGSFEVRKGAPKPAAGSPLPVGSLAPDFRLSALRGPQVVLSQLRGKVVLLDFWGTWCAPCRAAVPELRRLVRELEGQPFVLVGVNEERDPRKVEEFAVAHEMSWPQGWDDDRRVTAALYKVKSFPTYVLIDAEGKILHVQSGWSGRGARGLRARIQQALAAIPAIPAIPATPPAAPQAPAPAQN